ncbi:transcriptional regulator ArgP [Nocardioides psychrotolerans]|uniref:LysR family transcriptional regulator, chromosome initiation inhibitor n=1 Tax=Nocardioides psychrotolerans TaxID=1005945 RepID=A0A1I3R2Y1_9ACTN|nr:LysR family transcriptional regulator ArgP [Nocardioides psychrotolerans]GEP40320.1 transcriptional regulator ArgP [Nocardioides psychrotolerans]SFJ40943.1 LysR family transcriptional regulator, chromosome initiation inhibitor [Nocardioides psychrotolerans]
MEPQPAQLAALVAIIEHGTFDAAARHLHVTPSAVSQRIRALESAAGRVLVQRTTPCRPTEAGQTLLRLARQTRLLYDEARDALGDSPGVPLELAVAVSADSLATWFRPVMSRVATWPGTTLRLHVEDQAHTAALLRRGDVLAAVTSEPTPVQGCMVEPLGVLRYRPVAAPELAERWRAGRGYDWARMPVVVFNEKDDLQHDLLAGRGGPPSVVHRVPTSADFHEAVRRGLGWGMLPDPQALPDLAEGRVVSLLTRGQVDVPLFWQRWRLESLALGTLTDGVRAAARAGLRRPSPSP